MLKFRRSPRHSAVPTRLTDPKLLLPGMAGIEVIGAFSWSMSISEIGSRHH